MFWQLWSLVLSHGLVPNGLPWSPGWHVCSTCLQLCLSLCKTGIKCKSMQARMTGQRGNIFARLPNKIQIDDRMRVAQLYHIWHMCINTLFPVKRKKVQLKGTFFFLDLSSRSHFWYLETSTSQGPWEGEHQGQNPHMAQRKELFLSAGKGE